MRALSLSFFLYLRPQALHNVDRPRGPRRRSGVTFEWHSRQAQLVQGRACFALCSLISSDSFDLTIVAMPEILARLKISYPVSFI